jgi:hypothetical protein
VSWLDRIERWHNWASDTRFVWLPFEKLRPKKSQTISLQRRIVMALAFGGYYGGFVLIRILLWGEAVQIKAIAQTLLTATLIFFGWFNLVTAPLWNRRARRLIRDN